RADYSVVWWIRADSAASIAHSFLSLSARLGKQLSQDAPATLIIDSLKQLLARRDWLMIFDNASGADAIRPFIIGEGNGHVLITSRNPNWAGVAVSQPLKVMTRDESIEFLMRRTRRSETRDAADKLANALGDLPLALEQAAATIEQTGVTFADYLRRFETEWADLLQEGVKPVDYPHTVAMTWGLAFNAVETASAAAAELLNLCAFLCPDRITRKMLWEGEEHLPPRLRKFTDPLRLEDAISPLRNYSLVDADDRNISMHRLVATITRDRLDEERQIVWCNAAIEFLSGMFQFDSANVDSWAKCGELLPHVMDASSHADRLKVAPDITSELLNDAGRYLLKRGQYADAKAALDKALAICSRRYGTGHPKISSITNNLGRVHQNLGDDAAAIQCFEHALSIDEATYGHSHPHVAEVINNYGICLQKKGDSELARQQFEWAAQVYETHYGPDHAKLAHILNNLGYVLMASGNIESAHPHITRALEIAEKTVGPSHPTTARILYNLATVYRVTNQLPAAKEHLERALRIDETVLGPNHPDVANDCIAMSELLNKMGQAAMANAYYERATQIRANSGSPPPQRQGAPAAVSMVS
ncbi:MAG TPA: FxSxx-COOH system tetratricopeptide repeat protein, partial [Tepidisphaeraceae bacterium]|nr:FxSxx-COOH system tetratricopeptide repeat protein [Tepidisphaeraceae bacterium]